MNKSETISELAKALSLFQSEVRQPLKDKENPFFKSKFVPLENVVEVITETAGKHGLSFMQYPVNEDTKVGIITILMHSSGEYIETDPIFAQPDKLNAQATGSVITYLKRYSLAAVFGITSDVDDDGNNGSQPSPIKLSDVLKEKSTKLGKTQKDLYAEVSNSLNIKKTTKELTQTETNAIIAVLNKM